jgi:hypothetical protein
MHRTIFDTPIVNTVLRALSVGFLKLTGWKVVGSLPPAHCNYIAVGAQVPIVMAFLDYGKKTGGLGPAVQPSGNIDADMVAIKAFYAPFKGENADQFHTE